MVLYHLMSTPYPISNIHALNIRRELPPINIIQSYTTLCQPHKPLIHSHCISSWKWKNSHCIGFRDNQIRTDDFHHVKVTLYRWVIPLPLPLSRNSTPLFINYKQLEFGPSFHTLTHMKIMDKMGFGFNCQLLLSEIGLTMDLNNSTWFSPSN